MKLSDLPKEGDKVRYRGRLWTPNKPVPSDRAEKKRMVLAVKVVNGEKHVKLVHFGQKGYDHNYSEAARKNYLARSAGIKGKGGEPTKDDPFSPNYWARRVLWSKKDSMEDIKTDAAIKLGSTVSWKYGSGTAKGKTIRVYRRPVELEIKGAKIKRVGSAENPAYLVEQENGDRALKLASELTAA